MTASLIALGHAVPAAVFSQEELAGRQADAWGLNGRVRERWDRIVRGSGIARRHAIADLAQTICMTTGERMRVYEREAPELAARAAAEAIKRSAIDPRRVTDCILVSCTGFTAPGIGATIAPLLGLGERVRHNQVGFMGCFGGILGLRTAIGAACADPNAVVLVVCVELCSLHLRPSTDPQNLVASALFADGAAAAIVCGSKVGMTGLGELSIGRTRIVPNTGDEMTWRVGDDGFAMTLTREVPPALEECMGPFLQEDLPRGVVVHPGGAGILDAVERGISTSSLDTRSIPASRAVLRDYGNMSSGSVLFVLEEYLRTGGELPVDLVAFGPGLTVDAVRLG